VFRSQESNTPNKKGAFETEFKHTLAILFNRPASRLRDFHEFPYTAKGHSVAGQPSQVSRRRSAVAGQQLWLELVWLQSDNSQVVCTRLQGEFDIPLLPTLRLPVHRHFVELVLCLMPQLECQFDTSR